ncbi:hypothetical protein NECID01_0083 [Nematocida sp. AWRm77]|nr:hypothetical protein NECID01_0083 [Nematocida sp. AWRm77]
MLIRRVLCWGRVFVLIGLQKNKVFVHCAKSEALNMKKTTNLIKNPASLDLTNSQKRKTVKLSNASGDKKSSSSWEQDTDTISLLEIQGDAESPQKYLVEQEYFLGMVSMHARVYKLVVENIAYAKPCHRVLDSMPEYLPLHTLVMKNVSYNVAYDMFSYFSLGMLGFLYITNCQLPNLEFLGLLPNLVLYKLSLCNIAGVESLECSFFCKGKVKKFLELSKVSFSSVKDPSSVKAWVGFLSRTEHLVSLGWDVFFALWSAMHAIAEKEPMVLEVSFLEITSITYKDLGSYTSILLCKKASTRWCTIHATRVYLIIKDMHTCETKDRLVKAFQGWTSAAGVIKGTTVVIVACILSDVAIEKTDICLPPETVFESSTCGIIWVGALDCTDQEEKTQL